MNSTTILVRSSGLDLGTSDVRLGIPQVVVCAHVWLGDYFIAGIPSRGCVAPNWGFPTKSLPRAETRVGLCMAPVLFVRSEATFENVDKF
jgi:hypothetical protein